MSQNIAEFIDAAWTEHAADPRGVATRLADAQPLLEREPRQVGAFLWIAEHLLLGHLGDADAMEPCLALAAPLVAQQADAQPAFDRARLATRVMRGGDPRAGEYPGAIRVRACATVANALAVRGDFSGARRLLDVAATLARADGGADALKGLAAGQHNVATHLQDGPRGADADALMMEAARASRDTWAEAGTWLNVERGEYVLASCAATMGDGAAATGHARACLDICAAHDADAFERFFGHEALVRGLLAAGDRAAAAAELPALRTLLGGIADEGDRRYAAGCLDKLQALVNPA